jgi:ABC-type Mn2+/Zn2+ transport system ATPase subunit
VVRAERIELRAGRALGIFGPNGAGKTTLVRGITGLVAPLRGHVTRSSDVRISYLPQHMAMESHWPMSGFDAAAMVLSAQRPLGWIGSARAEVLRTMQALNVRDLAKRPFFALSGGQQQRLLLAAALSIHPNVLVLDEPTAGLDVHSCRLLLDVLSDFTRQGLCSVMISHEIDDLVEVCHEVVWVHPADEPEQPSTVELVDPSELGTRLTTARKQG